MSSLGLNKIETELGLLTSAFIKILAYMETGIANCRNTTRLGEVIRLYYFGTVTIPISGFQYISLKNINYGINYGINPIIVYYTRLCDLLASPDFILFIKFFPATQ